MTPEPATRELRWTECPVCLCTYIEDEGRPGCPNPDCERHRAPEPAQEAN